MAARTWRAWIGRIVMEAGKWIWNEGLFTNTVVESSNVKYKQQRCSSTMLYYLERS